MFDVFALWGMFGAAAALGAVIGHFAERSRSRRPAEIRLKVVRCACRACLSAKP